MFIHYFFNMLLVCTLNYEKSVGNIIYSLFLCRHFSESTHPYPSENHPPLAEIWVSHDVSYSRKEKSLCRIFHMQRAVSLTGLLSIFPYFSHNAHLCMAFISPDIMVMPFNNLSFIAKRGDKQNTISDSFWGEIYTLNSGLWTYIL